MAEAGDGESGERMALGRAADEKFCFACGRVIHLTARDCPHCGAAQPPLAASTSTAGPSGDGVAAGRSLAPLSASATAGQAILTDQVFCRGCGKPIHRTAPFCPHCGAPQAAAMAGRPRGQKDKSTAGILALLLGGIGVHKFYLEQPGLGVLYLLFCWTFIPALIGLIEGVIYLTMSDERFSRKYN